MKALTDFPDQRAWLMEDFDGRIKGAVEEFVRWATPIMTFRRTAARDCDLGGQQITEGDKVVLFTARPTGTPQCSPTRKSSICHGTPTRT